MTTSTLLALTTSLLIACAASAPHDTLPHTYSCNGTAVVISPSEAVSLARSTPFALRDGNADRYTSREGDVVVEYTVPHDHLLDATMTRFPVNDRAHAIRATCIAHAGYNDTLERYLHSPNMHAVATQLDMDDEAVEGRLVQAWQRVGKRFRSEP